MHSLMTRNHLRFIMTDFKLLKKCVHHKENIIIKKKICNFMQNRAADLTKLFACYIIKTIDNGFRIYYIKENTMYKIGDKIVYPMHGAGIVETIEEREVFGKTQSYYILKMPIGDLKIMIPTNADSLNGLRYVTSNLSINDFKEIFSSVPVDDEPNWNKRSRDNLEKIRSGDLYEIISVVKGLLQRECIKPLSTGEKKILSLAKQIMFSELIISLGVSQHDIEEIIDEFIGRN